MVDHKDVVVSMMASASVFAGVVLVILGFTIAGPEREEPDSRYARQQVLKSCQLVFTYNVISVCLSTHLALLRDRLEGSRLLLCALDPSLHHNSRLQRLPGSARSATSHQTVGTNSRLPTRLVANTTSLLPIITC